MKKIVNEANKGDKKSAKRYCGKKFLVLLMVLAKIAGFSACSADASVNQSFVVDGYEITMYPDGKMVANDCRTPYIKEEIPVCVAEDGALCIEMEFVEDCGYVMDENGNLTRGHNYEVGNIFTYAGREYVITGVTEYLDGEYPYVVVSGVHIITEAFVNLNVNPDVKTNVKTNVKTK